MRLLIVSMCGVLAGCGATMVRSARTDSPYAPTNEDHGGTVKYLSDGASFVVEGRRKDAYKQMYESCRGPYRIVEEHGASEGSATGVYVAPNATYGSAITAPINYEYITFQCNDDDGEPMPGPSDDPLARFNGHFVIITLKDGQTVAGRVRSVGPTTVVVEQTDGSRLDVPRQTIAGVHEKS
jgi:hypothetical protein